MSVSKPIHGCKRGFDTHSYISCHNIQNKKIRPQITVYFRQMYFG
jgi:hypothetical protein